MSRDIIPAFAGNALNANFVINDLDIEYTSYHENKILAICTYLEYSFFRVS